MRLAERVDCGALNDRLAAYYEAAAVREAAAAALADRGLPYLKHAHSLSDEGLVQRWAENTYWQAFCGEEFSQHEPPIHPSSLPRYRKRLRSAGCDELPCLTVAAGIVQRVIQERDLTELFVGTSLAQAMLNIGIPIKTAVAGKGYRGHETCRGQDRLPGLRSNTSAEHRWRRTRLRRPV